ncbi:ABC transporter ATP-binding protein [Marinobacter lacisalsi]|uniref:ABC transporter ATP-binding protein n=1 Tax=Marinobacter lacisalsi TaxID=475979 RepID=A0ABV8QJF1_9GAMM
MSQPSPVLTVRHLSVDYRLSGRRTLRAVDDVCLQVSDGETLALVGESGCGKSSIARAVMQLNPVAGGSVEVEGVDLARLGRSELKALRHRFQMIFQDPIASLNPRRRVRSILEAPLRIAGMTDPQQRRRRVDHILELTGMDPSVLDRYPHEFSGGQCQRLSIARALVLEPKLLVCDEPVSALDVSVRAQVLNLLNDLQRRLGLSMLFISHDLTVVRNVADQVAVMYLGQICETGPARTVLENPAHPYTRSLLSAVPVPDPSRRPGRITLMAAETPSHLTVTAGCRFAPRCPQAQSLCRERSPELVGDAGRRQVACHFPVNDTPDDSAGASSAGHAIERHKNNKENQPCP